MLGLLKSVKGVLKPKLVCNDNDVFRLHYKATTTLLFVCCLMVTSKQYIGSPIDCIVAGVNTKVMNSYCWIHSTFTVPGHELYKIGERVPHPGVVTPEEGDELKYHKYYQWVCFTLFFQALLFYAPHYLWKLWEGGKCQMLVMEMQSPVVKAETRHERQKLLTEYFTINLHHHNFYAFRFFFCEVLNLVNIVAQIFFTDMFLGYEFTSYGSKVINYVNTDSEDRIDPMAYVFPKVTKCTFHKYGASGTVQRIDGLCVLSVNIINEKIYVMLWFWFIALAVVTAGSLLFRLALIISPQMRLQMLTMRARLAPRDAVKTVGRRCQIGDWYVLCQMGKNMDPIAFMELIRSLAARFEGKVEKP